MQKMSEKEAIEWLKVINAVQNTSFHKNSLLERKEALHVAIAALEEIQRYRAIGTVKECWEALENQEKLKERITEYEKLYKKNPWEEFFVGEVIRILKEFVVEE